MGTHINWIIEQELMDAYDSQEVVADPGYFLLDECDPLASPEPVIARRTGPIATLAVTSQGCLRGEHLVLCPDRSVARKFKSYGADMPSSWPSLESWQQDFRVITSAEDNVPF